MTRVIVVFLAGGAGCVTRYLVGVWVPSKSFPYATLIVNLVGSFLIALILEGTMRRASFPVNLRIALTTGFMGGLTTYSSFNYETTTLATQDSSGRALINVGVTLIGCALAGLAGMWLGRRLAGS